MLNPIPTRCCICGPQSIEGSDLVKCVSDHCGRRLCATHATEYDAGRCPVCSFKGKVFAGLAG
jgi:hypothetical protein